MHLLKGNYFGSMCETRELNDYLISLSIYEPNSLVPNHFHQSPYWCLPITGAYLEKSRSRQFQIDNRQIIFRPSGYEHSNEFNNKCGVCLNIELKKSYPEDIIKQSDEPHMVSTSIPFNRILVAILNKIPDDELQCQIEEFIMHSYHKPTNDKISKVIDDIKSYIRENHRNPLVLSEIASIFYINQNYLSRKFKEVTGQTVGDYIRSVRITRSYFDIFHSSESLTSHALANGFYDQSHFIRHFKNTYGTTPLVHKNDFKKSIWYN